MYDAAKKLNTTMGHRAMSTNALGSTEKNDDRILSRAGARQIVDRLTSLSNGQGNTSIYISSYWNGEMRWARNRISLIGDRTGARILVSRRFDGGNGQVVANQLDEKSLSNAMVLCEELAYKGRQHAPRDWTPPIPDIPYPQSLTWSEATLGVAPEVRARLVNSGIREAETQNMLSAGYIEVRGASLTQYSSEDDENEGLRYQQITQAQCSITVRHPKGIGSGWAAHSSFAWNAINTNQLAELALEKCTTSLNPVAIEPGRYTVVLEPQAVYDLVSTMFASAAMGRPAPERPSVSSPFGLGYDETIGLGRSKLGLKVVDERITISHDPLDPEFGIVPERGMGPITWIEHGILKTLAYDRDYALRNLGYNLPQSPRSSFRMNGGDTSIEDMIRTTRRGLVVTRLHGVMTLDERSLLATGITRDGLWLIENGQITKAVKNMRITESPIIILNQVEEIGPPVFAFMPNPLLWFPALYPVSVPALKVRDFSFTSTLDAV